MGSASLPALAVAVVMVLHLGAWALLRLIRRRNARTAARFRESVRPVPLRGDGLDFSLQQQSRPFRISMWELLAYPNGSMVEGPEPGGNVELYANTPEVARRYQDIARDVIEREPTLARLPWLRKGRMFDEPDQGL